MTHTKRGPAYLILLAALMAGAGNGISMIAFPWLVLQRNGSALDASVVALAGTLPLLVATLIAGAAVELYAMTAVLGRLQKMIELPHSNGDSPGFERDLIVGKSFCRNAAHRIEQQLHSLFSHHDEAILRTADAVLGNVHKAGK